VIVNERLAMTGDAKRENSTLPGLRGTQNDRLAKRIEQMYADDEQFRNARPDAAIRKAVRQPDLRLPQVLETLVEGYADRPALGWRARPLTTDPATGRTTVQLLPRFDTITYRDLWANVRAIATAWRRDAVNPVAPGDFVTTAGFANPEYLTVDLVCGYLGLVPVPLQHNAAASRLQPIIAEVEPRILARHGCRRGRQPAGGCLPQRRSAIARAVPRLGR
jgi:fatty acid CoA ligase FadD9